MYCLRTRCGSFLAIIVMCIALVAPATPAEYRAWVFATFDDTPEGLAVDANGNITRRCFTRAE
jgi:hypothetical protein